MRKNLTFLVALSVLLIASCSKKESAEPGKLTTLLDKVCTEYYEGCNKYEGDDPAYDKEAEERKSSLLTDEQKQQLREYVQKKYAPPLTNNIKYGSEGGDNGTAVDNITAVIDVVAVIKNGTCGIQDELEIYMDCEDRRNQTSYSGNWMPTGWAVAGNVRMRFCAVPLHNFQQMNLPGNHFGVLNMGGISMSAPNDPSTYNGDTYSMWRYFDTEDNSNQSNFTIYPYGGAPRPPAPGEFTKTKLETTKDITLELLVFRGRTAQGIYHTPAVNALPSLAGYGMSSYGVFGNISFASGKSSIRTDDEDSNNFNYWNWGWPFNTNNPITHGGLSTIFPELGGNTRFNISRP